MSGEALYERYKDALKRGHVAALRGRIDEALSAYAEAAAIAPDRAMPHTSSGTALLRHGRPADALQFYASALELAPRDEAALLGRAQALDTLGRRGAAAEAYDAVAEIRVAADRLPDALDAARRALELAEGRDRRRALRRLTDRLRASEPDGPAREGLDRALRVLEGTAVEGGDRPGPAGATRAGPGGDPSPAGGPPAAGAWSPAIRGPLDRDVPDSIDTEALARAADEATDAGLGAAALERLLDIAAVHHRRGNIDAALDACYRGLSVAPDDVALHLALVELYGERGWSELAAGKLDLLERLATLDGGDEALARVAAARAGRG